MRQFTESFELGHLLRWSTGNDYRLTTPGLDGSAYSGNCIGGSRYGDFIVPARDEYFIGMFYNSQLSLDLPIHWFSGGTQIGFVFIDNATKHLGLYTGVNIYDSGITLTAFTTYHIQLRIKIGAAGAVQLKLDNLLVIDHDPDNTQPDIRTTIDQFRIGFAGGISIQDSICVNDTTGTRDTSWPGVVRMRGLAPIGNGFYATGAWSKNTGAAEWDHVEEIPPDNDTTYLSTVSANTYSSFSMADQALVFANYQAMIVSAVTKKDSGIVNLGVGFRIGSNDYTAAVSTSLPVAYGIVEGRLTEDPSTSLSWDSPGINSAEAFIFSTA